jgi:hypothetical protein
VLFWSGTIITCLAAVTRGEETTKRELMLRASKTVKVGDDPGDQPFGCVVGPSSASKILIPHAVNSRYCKAGQGIFLD